MFIYVLLRSSGRNGMGVESIHINNYKSLKNVKVYLQKEKYDIQCLVGKNGTGKSNFLDAIKYFYDCMESQEDNLEVIDQLNPYVQKMTIEVIYNFLPLLKNNTNTYYEQIFEELEEYIHNGRMSLKLVQYRNGRKEWIPQNINIRKSIHKLFPLYMIDTRFISLEDWSELWSIIGDIAPAMTRNNMKTYQSNLDDLYKEMYGEKYVKTINKIQNILTKENIGITSYDYRKQYKNILINRFGGVDFVSEGNHLNFYSDGLNSLKYIKLVIKLVSELSDTGWKNPIVILDEPEIGLHPHYIEELVEAIATSKKNSIDFIVSTHSSHLVSELIKGDLKTSIQRIFMHNKYTSIEKMKDIIDEKEKYLIDDMITDTYFSNAIFFVEGKTEIQVFKNKNILRLFPLVKKTRLYSFDADDQILRLANPSNINLNIPFMTIVDMDKILKYKAGKKKFKYNPDQLLNPLVSKEIKSKQRYYFYEKYNWKKKYTYNLSNKICKMIRQLSVEHTKDIFWIDNTSYDELLKYIKIYCMQFNMFPFKTTIEGAIINEKNFDIAIEWLTQKLDFKGKQILESLMNEDDNVKEGNYRKVDNEWKA